ncbi:MAG: hypothetical protein IH986_17550 [Planctomycetes bacterium]|nr:hypothetical protein [Planctomycetota bacterium]
MHLMSAGRLQVFDKRASLKDRRSRILIRLADGRELRLREFRKGDLVLVNNGDPVEFGQPLFRVHPG